MRRGERVQGQRTMQGLRRRVVYVGLYELIAILLSAVLLALMSRTGAWDSLGLAVAASA